jgi:hypothetical protein
MKIRNGFVSNSSSSSFVINTKNLSAQQIEAIRNHIEVAEIYQSNFSNLKHELSSIGYDFSEFDNSERYNLFDFFVNKDDEWNINQNGSILSGSTYLDNFDMDKFLQLIGCREYAEFSY